MKEKPRSYAFLSLSQWYSRRYKAYELIFPLGLRNRRDYRSHLLSSNSMQESFYNFYNNQNQSKYSGREYLVVT